jgi:hypothetical protein
MEGHDMELKNFIVTVKEIHKQRVRVQAENAEQARDFVQEGGGDYLDSEYYDTLDPDQWTVAQEDA